MISPCFEGPCLHAQYSVISRYLCPLVHSSFNLHNYCFKQSLCGLLVGEDADQLVVDRLKDELAKLGLALPEWVKKYEDFILGAVVDVVVAVLNRIGFFEHTETAEPASKPA